MCILRTICSRKAPYSEVSGREKTLEWLSARFDLTDPGASRVTEMLNGLHSIWRTSVIEWRAALEAQYMPFHGVGLNLQNERQFYIRSPQNEVGMDM